MSGGVIDLLAWKARKAGWQVMQHDEIDLQVYDNRDGRARYVLCLGEDTEELLLSPDTLRRWAAKMLMVAEQVEDAEMAGILAMEDA